MNSNPVNMSQQRLKRLLRKTWNELTDADAKAICRDPADLVHKNRRRHGFDTDPTAVLTVQRLLYETGSLARVCRRKPVSDFV